MQDHNLERLLQSERLFADETTAPVLDPGRGWTKTDQLWAHARDDLFWGGRDQPMVAYVYAADHKGERAEAHPGDFAGILQVDCSGDYAALAMRRQQVSLAFGWSHVRRKFYELADNSPVATEVPRRTAMLYAISDQVRGTSANALRTALTRWAGLSLFLKNGRIELDSNTVERSIWPLALNRKNALFAGPDEGGDNWAVIATLIENCKISGNPHAWQAGTLTKLASGHHASAIGKLMPWTAVA